MKNNNADPYNDKNRTSGDRTSNNPERDKMDLKDSKHDEERLQPDEAIIELPDVKDIPGQEFVQVPPLGMLADTTISSADEEGEGLFEDDEEDETDVVLGTEADISIQEKTILEKANNFTPTKDEQRLERASLDSTDFDGESLNEKSFGEERSGSDLDIPGARDETETDALGHGDEENKHFSLGSDENDLNESKTT